MSAAAGNRTRAFQPTASTAYYVCRKSWDYRQEQECQFSVQRPAFLKPIGFSITKLALIQTLATRSKRRTEKRARCALPGRCTVALAQVRQVAGLQSVQSSVFQGGLHIPVYLL